MAQPYRERDVVYMLWRLIWNMRGKRKRQATAPATHVLLPSYPFHHGMLSSWRRCGKCTNYKHMKRASRNSKCPKETNAWRSTAACHFRLPRKVWERIGRHRLQIEQSSLKIYIVCVFIQKILGVFSLSLNCNSSK